MATTPVLYNLQLGFFRTKSRIQQGIGCTNFWWLLLSQSFSFPSLVEIMRKMAHWAPVNFLVPARTLHKAHVFLRKCRKKSSRSSGLNFFTFPLPPFPPFSPSPPFSPLPPFSPFPPLPPLPPFSPFSALPSLASLPLLLPCRVIDDAASHWRHRLRSRSIWLWYVSVSQPTKSQRKCQLQFHP